MYGLDSIKYENIEGSIIIDTEAIVRININNATIDDLGHHPYIGYKMAKIIISYRSKHGPYRTVDDLGKIYSMDKAKLILLEKYLIFE